MEVDPIAWGDFNDDIQSSICNPENAAGIGRRKFCRIMFTQESVKPIG